MGQFKVFRDAALASKIDKLEKELNYLNCNQKYLMKDFHGYSIPVDKKVSLVSHVSQWTGENEYGNIIGFTFTGEWSGMDAIFYPIVEGKSSDGSSNSRVNANNVMWWAGVTENIVEGLIMVSDDTYPSVSTNYVVIGGFSNMPGILTITPKDVYYGT